MGSVLSTIRSSIKESKTTARNPWQAALGLEDANNPLMTAFYRFDNRDSSNIFDETPNNNDATFANATFASGVIGDDVIGDGVASIVNTPLSLSGLDELTIIQWMRGNSADGATQAVNWHESASAGAFKFFVDLSPTNMVVEVGYRDSNSGETGTGKFITSANNAWVNDTSIMVGLTFSKAANECRLWLNGADTGLTAVFSGFSALASAQDIQFLNSGGSNYRKGRVGLWRLYSTYVFTAADMTYMYNGGAGR